jgi:hypothetical protein
MPRLPTTLAPRRPPSTRRFRDPAALTISVPLSAAPAEKPLPKRHWLAVLLPVVAILLIAFPLFHYQLPNFKSTLTEEYQPFKTLKFLTSAGGSFHKWGPVDNFLLAPGYLLTFGYWKVTGQFTHGSSEFPYGLTDPLRQISFLILQSRILLLSLGMLAMFLYTRSLGRLVPHSSFAAPLAVLLVIATNPVLVFNLVALKPDAPMIIFSALALASYVHILTSGLTVRRACAFACLAAIAMSAKESALPLLGLPLLYLLIAAYRRPGVRPHRIAFTLLASFTLTYLCVSVIYAPATWWQRMTFWFGGPGMDAEIWGASDATWRSLAMQKITGVANNLGPAGLSVALVCLLVFVTARPSKGVALMLPLAGFAAALVKIGYAADYFVHPLSLALAPILTVALDRLLSGKSRARLWKHALVGGAVTVNFYYAQIAWLLPFQSKDVLIERDVASLRAGASFSLCALYRPSARTRLQALDFQQDTRTLPELIADGPEKLPEFLYQSDDEAQWMADLPNRPERAKMILREAHFDYRAFPGLAAWNYRPVRTLRPKLPGWYPFTFMPIAAYDPPVRLYHRETAPPTTPTAR